MIRLNRKKTALYKHTIALFDADMRWVEPRVSIDDFAMIIGKIDHHSCTDRTVHKGWLIVVSPSPEGQLRTGWTEDHWWVKVA